jgi:RecA-family ATPase
VRDRFPALNWHDLWADDTQDEWIIEPLLPARRLVALFSPPKVGKSLLMLELAVAIARGTEALGAQLDRPHRVLYIDFENDPRGDIRTRLQAMGHGPDDLDNLVYLSYPRLAYLDTTAGALELLAICGEYDVEVVVIDTISRAVNGEENDNDTWLAFYRHTGLALKAAGIATIRLDHTGKDHTKGMRGGSAKYGDVDAVWAMTKVSDTTFQLECTAHRLPIPEKTLLIDRQVYPQLRHTINTTGRDAADEALLPAIIHALDLADFPYDGNGGGVRPARKLLTGRGWTTRQIDAAVAKRRRRGPFLEPGPLPYKED